MKTKPRELLEKEAKLLEYYNDVVHYLRAFNIDENLIDDAIQDTFVEALSSLDTLRDETKMKYWLIKIAKRVGSKYVTKCKKAGFNIRLCKGQRPSHSLIFLCGGPGYEENDRSENA